MGARLFTAVLPPWEFVEELDHFLGPRREAEPRLRWTRPESWHLTTAFLGDVPERVFDRLTDEFAVVASRTAAFPLRIGGAGAFPWPRETKHLWLGVTTGADALTALARRCRNAASHAGASVDGARFTPHLTLARANRPLDSTRLIRVLETFEASAWPVTDLVLIESYLRDRGSRYEVLERFPLTHKDTSLPPGADG